MKINFEHPAIAFAKEYWQEILIAAVLIACAGRLYYVTMEVKVLKATLVNATTTIKNYQSAEQDNMETIRVLRVANDGFAAAADAAIEIAESQLAMLEEKDAAHDAAESKLKSQLDEAHAKNKVYSDAVVPRAVSDRLRQNSRPD